MASLPLTLNNVLPLVSSHLNIQDHCRVAGASKAFYLMVGKQNLDTLENRKILAKICQLSEDINIEFYQANIKSRMLALIQDPTDDLLVARVNSAIENLFVNNKMTLQLELEKIHFQNIVSIFSLNQISKIIALQKDHSTFYLIQKMANLHCFENPKYSQRMAEITKSELEFQFQIVNTLTEIHLEEELPLEEKKAIKIPIDIKLPAREVDTIGNRLWFADLFLKTGYVADQIPKIEALVISSGLKSAAMLSNIAIDAIPNETQVQIKYAVHNTFKMQFKTFHSILNNAYQESIIKFSPLEIRQMITLYSDPSTRSMINAIEKIQTENTDSLNIKTIKQVYEILGPTPGINVAMLGV